MECKKRTRPPEKVGSMEIMEWGRSRGIRREGNGEKYIVE